MGTASTLSLVVEGQFAPRHCTLKKHAVTDPTAMRYADFTSIAGCHGLRGRR